MSTKKFVLLCFVFDYRIFFRALAVLYLCYTKTDFEVKA